MKYSLVKVETLKPGARFVLLERSGYGSPPKAVTYIVFKRDYDDIFYEWKTYATVDEDKRRYRFGFSDGTLVFAEDP